MSIFEKQGSELRNQAKAIVFDYMTSSYYCAPGGKGLKQATIFRDCGLDWGDCLNATSSNQQYWLVALLRELETEGKVERVIKSGPWRLL